MKALFVSTAALALMASAPAFAQSVGSVGATYSNSSIDGFSGDSDSYAIDGVVAIPAFTGWTATIAGQVAHNDEANDTAFSGTAHLTTMAGSDLRFGGFVGAADLGDDNAYTAGAVVQKYLNQATLSGSLAYTTADDADLDAWTLGADAAFYPMANLRLNAGVSYSNLESGGFDADLWTYGVGAEYQLASTPFSVVGGYTRGDIEDIEVDTWSIGLRYSFGGGLQARDRAGATLPATGISSILGAL